MHTVEDAIESLRKGKPVLVFDAEGREEETDILVASQFVTSDTVRLMRKEGGGLICTAVHPDIAEKLGIPFIVDVLRQAAAHNPVLNLLEPNDIPYDEKSSFSITINHRKTFTGITDSDRALTISEFAKLAADTRASQEEFGKAFRAPGHVILLRAVQGLLKNRQGHTELSVALMELAGLTPVATICEMMADDGKALGIEKARAFAKTHGLVFIEGKKIQEFWLKNNGHRKG